MRGFTLNLLMALVWALFSGDFSTRAFVVGYLVGYLVLWLFPRSLGTGGYVRRSLAGLRFIGFFLAQLTLANVQVALFALQQRPPLYPMIVAVPLRVQSPSAQTMLAAIITLMPGTVAMGFSADRRTLYAHAIGLEDPKAVRQSIQKVESELLQFWTDAPSPEDEPPLQAAPSTRADLVPAASTRQGEQP